MAPTTSTRRVAFSGLMSRIQIACPLTERALVGRSCADSHKERLTLGSLAENSGHGPAACAAPASQASANMKTLEWRKNIRASLAAGLADFCGGTDRGNRRRQAPPPAPTRALG
jgi:hypothetical protein